ncbi:PDR/VanB family oxidoreductase [Amycolatopsis sp. OK19-0408]|uniref:PDR/VanB family oxidoreductase n=1 Tax=Amycolatopsis iheyensis TaxID=2945988 RepID=A0A9X2NKM5_9PSEU|nr:PDR/VanB family oxidoreductase [Amycolatopsis iheyensis]MCR6489552.1 PDR/VanB family oxidoreductase [Amycolatopsis iheyensis]
MTLELVLAHKEKLADDVVRLTLRAPDGTPLPPWEPGAHVDLVLPGDVVRQYSLCGRPEDTSAYQVAVLREPGGRGGSARVHELVVGQRLRVDGPRNHFALVDAERYLFLAGGIGITPLLPMISHVAAAGRDWQLVYGGRTRSSMAFTDLLSQDDRVTLRPQDEHGLLDLPSVLAEPRPDTAVYCCGPEPLLAAVEAHCASWPSDALHVERFAPKAAGSPQSAFEVELAGSGRVLPVPADRSILDVAEEAGLPVLSSCREGTCGTCETGVLGGTPDHRDSVLTEAEQRAGDVLMICVSRSCSPRLVLDL